MAVLVTSLVLVACLLPRTATAQPVTVLHKGQIIEVERTLADPNDLWVVPEVLPLVNGFELKPEGACLDELCVPVLQDRDSEILVIRSEQKWFNVTELARRLGQPFIVNHEHHVWSFGDFPVTRQSFLSSALAPDFGLPDRKGNLVRLSDFSGKKVLIVTWASW